MESFLMFIYNLIYRNKSKTTEAPKIKAKPMIQTKKRILKLFANRVDGPNFIGSHDQMMRDAAVKVGQLYLQLNKIETKTETIFYFNMKNDVDLLRGHTLDEVHVYNNCLENEYEMSVIRPALIKRSGNIFGVIL